MQTLFTLFIYLQGKSTGNILLCTEYWTTEETYYNWVHFGVESE